MSHTLILNQSRNKWIPEDRVLILDFIKYCFEQLYINKDVIIKLESESNDNIDIGVKVNLRLAFVNLEERLIIIYCKDRGLLDILRSLAHELIHVQQLDLGLIDTNVDIDFYLPSFESKGYEFEYEAYGLSGILVRNFRALLNGAT